MSARRPMMPWAGLAAGPGAWAAHTQIAYALAPWTCGHKINLVAPLAALSVIVALAGAAISWRAWHILPQQGPLDAPVSEQPKRFVAAMGTGLGFLFALVILMQGVASLVLSGCAR